MIVVHLVADILIKILISLLVAAASVIGTKLTTMLWDKYANDEMFTKKEQVFAY